MSLLMGHRGARAEYPENTLGGFAYTQNLQDKGVLGIEFDVQLTKDKKLAVFHDDSATRCTSTQHIISQTHSSQLSALTQHKLFQLPQFTGKNFTPDAISLLADILPFLTGYKHIELEVKTFDTTNKPALVASLVKSFPEFSHLPITFTSFDPELLHLLQQARTFNKHTAPTGLLIEKLENKPVKPFELLNITKRLGCSRVGFEAELITNEIVSLLHQHDIQVSAWTVNDAELYKKLTAMGVDAIITDHAQQFSEISV